MDNADPRKLEGYYFRKLENLLGEVGQYRLEYELEPAVPGKIPLKISTLIQVSAGPPKYFKISVPICAFFCKMLHVSVFLHSSPSARRSQPSMALLAT